MQIGIDQVDRGELLDITIEEIADEVRGAWNLVTKAYNLKRLFALALTA